MSYRIIQVLQWNLNVVKMYLPKFAEQGFNVIQISPVTPTKDSNNHEFWIYYQPTDFTIGNQLGTKDDFICLCEESHKYNIKIVVDVVLRHLAGRNDGSLYPHEKDNSYISNNKELWLDPIEGNCNDRWQETNRCFGMPTLNYYNPEMVEIYRNFLAEILTYADGIRIDMEKHFSLPYEGGYLFWDMIKDVTKDKICYGECINCPQWRLDDYCKYNLVLTDKYNTPTNKDNAVVFAESHDTYCTFESTKHWDDNKRLLEYEDAVKNFRNTLFYARPWDNLIWSYNVKELNHMYNW